MIDARTRELANAIRLLAADAVEHAASGHPGMPMGMADVATVLFSEFLTFDPRHPTWPNRDRFVLSAGHGSMLLYALLYLTGYRAMTLDQLKNFRQLGSLTPGHPEVDRSHGVETTTGPLGQGLANAVGMALAEAKTRAELGPELVNHFTYTIVGDGCLMEGISEEAITFAAHLKLGHLIVLFDDNKITIDGPTSLSTSADMPKRFAAAGWHVQVIDGHDPSAIRDAIAAAQKDPRPSFIACATTIAYGTDKKAGTAASHGAPLGAAELAAARTNLDWPHAPFEIPEDILAAWRSAGRRSEGAYAAWEARWVALPTDTKVLWDRRLKGDLPPHWADPLSDWVETQIATPKAMATRQSSQLVLDVLEPLLPELLGGSADLTGSNNTKAKGMGPLQPDHLDGQYISYGIREHAMAAIMNGLALYGGYIPYGGTFLTFSDYMRNALRLSALMNLRVIYVLTHDSIGLGEDGPTHQPIEHLMSLRLIPHLRVFRPADTAETAACWRLALEDAHAPSVLALSRQSTPPLPWGPGVSPYLACAQGAYVVRTTGGAHKNHVTLIATGTEVALALAVQDLLPASWWVTVVSMPCWELFAAQPQALREEVIDPRSHRVAIELGSTLGWERYVGEKGLVIGIDSFGASGPIEALLSHFGFTPDTIAGRVRAHVEGKD